MSDLDTRLAELLNKKESMLEEPLAENGYYKEVLSSFRGDGAYMRLFAWLGILTFGTLLIYCIYQLFVADTTRMQIIFAAMAVMLNSAQIALKHWFNMRLNRRAVVAEIRKLRLDLASSEPMHS